MTFVNSQCMGLYGCELININNKNEINNLFTNCRKFCFRVINFSVRTNRKLIPKLMNRRNIAIIIVNIIMNFVIKNVNHKNYIV